MGCHGADYRRIYFITSHDIPRFLVLLMFVMVIFHILPWFLWISQLTNTRDTCRAKVLPERFLAHVTGILDVGDVLRYRISDDVGELVTYCSLNMCVYKRLYRCKYIYICIYIYVRVCVCGMMFYVTLHIYIYIYLSHCVYQIPIYCYS